MTIAAQRPEKIEQARTKAFDDVIGCRSITDSAQRLACFDASVAALQTAASNRDIVVVDREEVHKARRSLFGFNLPSLKIFGDGGDDASGGRRHSGAIDEEESEITATVASARKDGDGNWIVVLNDSAIWHQTDGTVAVGPRPGDTVTIRRASLGSYFMRIGKQPGVKARRES